MNQKIFNLQKLKEELSQNLITYSQAFEKIKKLPKSWSTSEWTNERDKLIKKSCEQCGSTEGTMVLQHLRQPENFSIIKDRIALKLFAEFLKVNPIEFTQEEFFAFIQENHKIRKGCPRCRKISLMERKKSLPKYQCNACKYDFNDAIDVKYIPKIRKKVDTEEEKHVVLQGLIEFRRAGIFRKFCWENDLQIGKVALIDAIEQSIRYESLVDTVTFCKRCAFTMDVARLSLCKVCGNNYHVPCYDSCFKCFKKEN